MPPEVYHTMSRIPPALIEAIKREVPCVAVLEARGAVFQAHGGDVVCSCPFHADRTPSCVVSAAKNLWHCFGACQSGGDVIALVQRLEGVSFRGAVERLALRLGSGAVAALEGVEAARRRSPAVSEQPCPLDPARSGAGLLEQAVAYYAARLAQPGSAGRAYLASRGLGDAALLQRFRVGFCDQTLGLRLPARSRPEGTVVRARLEEAGLLKGNGHERFSACVVVPILGAEGTVVGLYGRKARPTVTAGVPKHLYLPGPHRGVWHGPVAAGAGELCAWPDAEGAVVLCEAVFDAMTFWTHGIRHVTASYGVSGFTPLHRSAFAAAGVRTVFIAYDADEAGDRAAAGLGQELASAGVAAWRVPFPPGEDANSVAVAAGAAAPAVLAEALRQATRLGGPARVAVAGLAPPPAPCASAPGSAAAPADTPATDPAPAVPVSALAATDTDEVTVVTGGRSYRVRGLGRNRGADVLRVNVRVAPRPGVPGGGTAGSFHIDTVDLYQTRLRQAFIVAAAHELGVEPELIKTDLGQVLVALEAEQTRRAAAAAAAAASGAGAAPVPTGAEREAALAQLRSSDLCARIVADVQAWGLVGEEDNILVAYLAATSRLLAQPLAVVVQASSAAGKSTLIDAVLALHPPEAVRRYSALSDRSPFYLGSAQLRHRVLAIAEEEGARRASYALKLLQSDGVLRMAATGKDPRSGRLVTNDYEVTGPVALMLTTTAAEVDPELMNRCLVLTVDEGPAQTAAIQAAQRRGRTLAGLEARRQRTAIERRHHALQRLLSSVTVVNPHAEGLSFAAGQARLRRDHATFLSLIDAVAVLHQHQRERRRHTCADGTVLDYIEATPADIALATRLMAAVVGRGLDEVPPPTRSFYDRLVSWAGTRSAAAGSPPAAWSFTRHDVCGGLGATYKQARTHLDRLEALEWVVAGGARGAVRWYRLVAGAGTAPAGGVPTSGGLPTPCPTPAQGPGAAETDGGCRVPAPVAGGLPASDAGMRGPAPAPAPAVGGGPAAAAAAGGEATDAA